jgi:hypothetical protein
MKLKKPGSTDDSEEGVIMTDSDLVERIFELRFTIAESEDAEELKEIHTALIRDYNEEIRSLTVTFSSSAEGDSLIEGKRRQIINRARYL